VEGEVAAARAYSEAFVMEVVRCRKWDGVEKIGAIVSSDHTLGSQIHHR
jgi:hypothetical protein